MTLIWRRTEQDGRDGFVHVNTSNGFEIFKNDGDELWTITAPWRQAPQANTVIGRAANVYEAKQLAQRWLDIAHRKASDEDRVRAALARGREAGTLTTKTSAQVEQPSSRRLDQSLIELVEAYGNAMGSDAHKFWPDAQCKRDDLLRQIELRVAELQGFTDALKGIAPAVGQLLDIVINGDKS